MYELDLEKAEESLIKLPTSVQFSSVQLLSHVQLFLTPWTTARQASLSIRWITEKAREFEKNVYFWFYYFTEKLGNSRKTSTSGSATSGSTSAKACDYADHNKLWKVLKEMGMPKHLTCFLRNLYAGQEATVRPGHGTVDWFKIGKGVCQGYILSPCLFNFYAEYIWEMVGWIKHKLESRLLGKISTTSGMQMIPPWWHKAKRN